MGDLATEIEQMQNDIHAFDEELDALEQWVLIDLKTKIKSPF